MVSKSFTLDLDHYHVREILSVLLSIVTFVGIIVHLKALSSSLALARSSRFLLCINEEKIWTKYNRLSEENAQLIQKYY
jgi:hypothetical protein